MNEGDKTEATLISDRIIVDLRKTLDNSFEREGEGHDGYTLGLAWFAMSLSFFQGNLVEMMKRDESGLSIEKVEEVVKEATNRFFKDFKSGKFLEKGDNHAVC